MASEHQGRDEEDDRRGEDQRREAEQHYERAQTGGSFEHERAARQSLDMQTLRNHVDRLERRVLRLEQELTDLKSSSDSDSI